MIKIKKIMIIFIIFSSLTFSKGYNVNPKDITESVRIVNAIIFGSENIEHYNTSAGSGTIKGFKEKYLVYGEKYLNKY